MDYEVPICPFHKIPKTPLFHPSYFCTKCEPVRPESLVSNKGPSGYWTSKVVSEKFSTTLPIPLGTTKYKYDLTDEYWVEMTDWWVDYFNTPRYGSIIIYVTNEPFVEEILF